MNKNILNFRKSQVENHFPGLSRSIRRSKAFYALYKQGFNPKEIYEFIHFHKERNSIAYKILNHILFLASKGLHAFPSVSRLQLLTVRQDGTVAHEKSICRVTAQLADLGYIKKKYRGFVGHKRRSPVLLLNRIFNNGILQYLIAPLFPFFAFLSFNIFFPTLSHCKEHFIYRPLCLLSTDVTYIRYKEELNKSITNELYVDRERLTQIGGFYNVCARERGSKSMNSIIGNIFSSLQPQVEENRPHTVTQQVKKPFVAPSPTGYAGATAPESVKYPYSPFIDELVELKQLRMSAFGKMKLSVIPEGVVKSLYNYYIQQGSNLPHNERFFQECLDICKRENVCLKSRWTRFYDACDKRKINAKKELCTVAQQPKEIDITPRAEEDETGFWRVELAWAENPRGYWALGCPKNPFEDKVNPETTRHKMLFALYLQAKQNITQRNTYLEALKIYSSKALLERN